MGARRRLDSSDFIEALTILPALWALWALWVLQAFGVCRASEMSSAVSCLPGGSADCVWRACRRARHLPFGRWSAGDRRE
ncbi:hypothetical protein WI97_01040 [Burkholderia vietnamiensis]|nr:hypothetical protein WI97_01040 [Burkholderia vietnamiensis]